jgi:hypothetical protein
MSKIKSTRYGVPLGEDEELVAVDSIVAVVVEDEDGSTRTFPVCFLDLIDIGQALDQEDRERFKRDHRRHQQKEARDRRKKAKSFVADKLTEIAGRAMHQRGGDAMSKNKADQQERHAKIKRLTEEALRSGDLMKVGALFEATVWALYRENPKYACFFLEAITRWVAGVPRAQLASLSGSSRNARMIAMGVARRPVLIKDGKEADEP